MAPKPKISIQLGPKVNIRPGKNITLELDDFNHN